jgi:hypothetical protein
MTDTSGMFTVGNAMAAVLTENDPQTYGPPVDRAAFQWVSGPACPAISGKGPQIISGTLQISQAGQPVPPPTPTPAPTLAQWPSPEPSLNFAGGDFVVVNSWNGCRIHVTFAATSKADGTGASGAVVMTAVPSESCQGQATGRITCLLVTGSHAVLSAWLDDTSGIFSIGNVLQATVTKNDPQTYGPPVDRAGFGLADGSPECPPGISGMGPQIISGTLQVSQARQPGL